MGFFPSAAIALLLSPPLPPLLISVVQVRGCVCTMQVGMEDVRDLLTTGSKEGSAMIGERRNPFFPLSCALPFRIILSRMLFHLIRVVPSFPIAHDWLQGGMRGAELRASTILPPPSLGKIGAQQKANYAKQWKKERKGRRQAAGALGNSRVISMWVGWSRRRR